MDVSCVPIELVFELSTGHCKMYRDTGSKVSHQIELVIGFRVRDRVKALRFMDTFRDMVRVRALGIGLSLG